MSFYWKQETTSSLSEPKWVLTRFPFPTYNLRMMLYLLVIGPFRMQETCLVFLPASLKINFNKSKLYGIGVHTNELNSFALEIGCQHSQLPFIYFGLPVGANMSRCTHWSPLVERFRNRLSNWKCRTLSYGGRLTLIKSVLGSLRVYFFSTFKAPITIINNLERIRKNFFWGGSSEERKIAWVAWEKVIAPLDQGGLNIGSLKVFNQAMLSKWWWRFLNEENALWRKLIVSIHGHQGGLQIGSSLYKSGPWYQIMRLKDDFLSCGITLPSLSKRKIGNGQTTRFWLDPWLGGSPLNISFSRLFRLESNPGCLVRDRAPQPSVDTNLLGPPVNSILFPSGLHFHWAWARPIRSVAEHQELDELVNLLTNLSLSNDHDCWECTITSNRLFTVKSMRSHIRKFLHPLNPQPFRWNKALPSKINILSWRILHKRLPTRFNLDRRGVDLDSIRCPVCDEDIETEEHLFTSCYIATETWRRVFTWWKIHDTSITSLSDAVNLADSISFPAHHVIHFDAVVQTTLWSLWRFRNEMSFSIKRPSKDMLLNDIKLSSFNWISSRLKMSNMNWIVWFDNPQNILCN
ncbi:putative RNA-directed DNA polymerase, eukaryota, reverse transcriptase zinc-binding domain protein [Tanacetum coccineum]